MCGGLARHLVSGWDTHEHLVGGSVSPNVEERLAGYLILLQRGSRFHCDVQKVTKPTNWDSDSERNLVELVVYRLCCKMYSLILSPHIYTTSTNCVLNYDVVHLFNIFDNVTYSVHPEPMKLHSRPISFIQNCRLSTSFQFFCDHPCMTYAFYS